MPILKTVWLWCNRSAARDTPLIRWHPLTSRGTPSHAAKVRRVCLWCLSPSLTNANTIVRQLPGRGDSMGRHVSGTRGMIERVLG